MKNSKFVFDKFTKLLEQGLVSSRDLKNEIVNILKSKRDEIVFKMKLTSKDEFDILAKRVENLEKELDVLSSQIQCRVGFRGISYGNAQKPKLWDYADGVDTMDFLTKVLKINF